MKCTSVHWSACRVDPACARPIQLASAAVRSSRARIAAAAPRRSVAPLPHCAGGPPHPSFPVPRAHSPPPSQLAVLQLEEMVAQFVGEDGSDLLEFPPNGSNFAVRCAAPRRAAL